MIESEIKEGICTGNHKFQGCGRERMIVNKFFKLCYKCNCRRLLAKSPKVQRQTGELELFKKIWMKRPHLSEVSGQPIKFHISCFSHILPKSTYPEYRLVEDNIVLKTPQEHHDWEFARYKLKDLPEWKKIFILENRLKIIYNETHRRGN